MALLRKKGVEISDSFLFYRVNESPIRPVRPVIRAPAMATGVPNYKIILCGEYGVGKSAIFRRFLDNSYTPVHDRQSTIGLDHSVRIFKFDNTDIKLTLWDTGGMERMSFVGSSYYRGAQAALLCYNMANRETFSFLSQYVLDIVMNAEGAKIFLCGNMADQRGDNSVTDAEVDNFVRDCGDVLSGVYQISCKDNNGIIEMFSDIAQTLYDAFRDRRTMKQGVVLRASDIEGYESVNYKKQGSCCKS